MAKKEIGVGVIGLGMGSGMFALNQNDSTRLEVRAICSQTEAKVKALSEKYSIDSWTTDYRELVKRKDIDVVAVYSPDHLHHEHCVAALKAGKHVVCTKPLTNNLEYAKELVRLVRETKLKFLVGQTMRYDPQMTAAKRFFDDGEIGGVIFAEAHYVHDLRPIFGMTPWRLTAPQDFMFGGVCHPVDVLRWFMGDIEELHAFGCKGPLTPEYPLMDNFSLNVKFTNGAIGRILGLYGVIEPTEPMMKVSLFGTKMNVVATYSDNLGGQVKTVWDKIDFRPTSTMPFPVERGIDVYGHTNSIVRYMKHLEDCIVNNKEPSPSVLDGAKTISAGAAAWQSIKEDRVVKVFNEF
jgi:predicted dehydrogenase